MSGDGSRRRLEMVRKEFDCDKKTSSVILSDSEAMINSLPGDN
jgi:hypothetical protein